MTVSAVIFDLDGTLIDSRLGIESCLRTALEAAAPSTALPPIESLIGPPVRDMIAGLLPGADAVVLDAAESAFRSCYDTDGWQATRAYPGVVEVLDDLASAGVALYVVTNKPPAPTRRILDHLGLFARFARVVARDDAPATWGDKAAATARLVVQAGLDPATCLFVGDSADDAEAARANGMRFAVAAYGYGGVAADPGDAVLADIADLPAVVAAGGFAVKATLRPCPICDGREAEVLHRQRFSLPDAVPLPSEYDVVACATCGFVFADTPACQADYDVLYRELSKYEDTATATGGGHSELDRRRLEVTAGIVGEHLGDRSLPLADMGCGNGGLLAALADLGYMDLTGIDPSPVCAARVESIGFTGIAGGLLSLDEATRESLRGRFACVTLSHVLEHLCDVRAAMTAALDLLAPGGSLYVEVPDAAAYAERYVVPYYYFDIEHINHFDGESLRNLAAVHGLGVTAAGRKDIEVPGGVLYPAVWAFMRRDEAAPRGIAPGRASRDAVVEYVRRSREQDAWPELEALASSGEPVCVWGAGSYAQRMMRDTPLRRCAILRFVDTDSKKHGTRLEGVPVESPDALSDFTGTVVVCAALQGAEIETELRRRGFGGRILRLDGGR
jgi:phosphoglycolate phosphatase-like HAD superfamily hydrolase/SAM-dependent methyltransferase